MALVPRDPEAEIEAIRADVVALEVRDLGITHDMDRAADLSADELTKMMGKTDKEIAAAGWTRRGIRIALYALNPRGEAPYFLQAAHERTLARVRRHSEDASGVNINVKGGTFNILAPAPRARDIDVVVVEPEKKR
jgi:hypothetical protein